MHLISRAAIKNFTNGMTGSFYCSQFHYIAFLTALLRAKLGQCQSFLSVHSVTKEHYPDIMGIGLVICNSPHCNFLWNRRLNPDAVSEEPESVAGINGISSNFVQVKRKENNPLAEKQMSSRVSTSPQTSGKKMFCFPFSERACQWQPIWTSFTQTSVKAYMIRN